VAPKGSTCPRGSSGTGNHAAENDKAHEQRKRKSRHCDKTEQLELGEGWLEKRAKDDRRSDELTDHDDPDGGLSADVTGLRERPLEL
jgi:hypothetical protein